MIALPSRGHLIIMAALFLLLEMNCHSRTLTLGEIFHSPSQSGIYLDPNLRSYRVQGGNLPENPREQLAALSRILPLRIEQDRGYTKVLPVVYRDTAKIAFFECLIFGGSIEDSQAIHQKVKESGGWFLRGRVRWTRFQGRFAILFSVSTRFFLNQFLEDYLALTNFLFGKKQNILKINWESWLTLHRDLLYENYTGTLPDLYQGHDPRFSRSKRLGVGSNLLP
jgi:hypothetical protein